jgi:hypothetical protein
MIPPLSTGPSLSRTMSPANNSGRASPGSPISRSSAAGDEPTAGGPAPVAGLRRNMSNEGSRLRGPKGARGPRPVPGSSASSGGHGHSSRGSVSAMAAQFETK